MSTLGSDRAKTRVAVGAPSGDDPLGGNDRLSIVNDISDPMTPVTDLGADE